MENNNKIIQELKEISPLLIQFKNSTLYRTSNSYFNAFADTVIDKIKSGAEPSYYLTKQNVYSAPLGYFESLSATIVQKIKAQEINNEVFEEMEGVSPFLNTISKTPVYSVPSNYFSSLAWNKNLTPVNHAKVISLSAGKKALRYLAAAVIIGVLAIGVYLFAGKQPGSVQGSEQAVSQVKTLSEQEIVDFLKTTAPTETIASTASSNLKYSDIKNSVSKMSDTEIQQFLQDNGDEM